MSFLQHVNYLKGFVPFPKDVSISRWKEVTKWITENVPVDEWSMDLTRKGWRFKREEDAVLFQLTWC